MKGARREIKKDNQFLARQKLNEQLEKYVTFEHGEYNQVFKGMGWMMMMVVVVVAVEHSDQGSIFSVFNTVCIFLEALPYSCISLF